jgi:peptide/nickel transport system substrate-binding protein
VIFAFGLGEPRHFNPAVMSGSATAVIGTQVFASPLRYDENWNPLPYQAQSWEISEDGLAVTLHLVEGATFHDGHPVTSEDVAFSLMVVKQYHPFNSMFAPVERVDTPDEHTAIIRLSQPHPAILLAMSPALLPILPKHVYGDGQDLSTHPANWAPIGSGPFEFVEYLPGESIVFERFDDYFIPGLPYLDGVVFRIENDLSVQMIDLERKEAHLATNISDPDAIERLSGSEHLGVTSLGYEGLGPLNWLAFNMLREPLQDVRVRHAIAYALDPDFIAEYLHRGLSVRATGPIAPDSPFYEPAVRTYEIDLREANRLLDEAGYPPGQDGIRFELSLDHIPVGVVDRYHGVLSLYIQRQLAEIGIQVEVRRSGSFPEWAERIGNWDFDLTLDTVYNWADPVIGVHRTYLSDNIRRGVVWSNTQNYRNSSVDDLLNQAAIELDLEERAALYSEFQQILAEDLPVVWIDVVAFHTVYHVGLRNVPISIWGVMSPMDELYWERQPDMGYIPPAVLQAGQNGNHLRSAAIGAIDLIQKVGLYQASEVLSDPEQGYLDLEGSGLHVIGVSRSGFVFLDNSGQTQKGIDISQIMDLDGVRLLTRFVEAADGGGFLQAGGVWPHPATHEVGPMIAWCGLLSQQDVVCAMEWR